MTVSAREILKRLFFVLAAIFHLQLAPSAFAQLDEAPEIEAMEQLGIELPADILRRPAISRELQALAREKCDREAIIALADALENETYRREAAEGLVSFSADCSGHEGAMRRAINLFLDLSDYGRAIEAADELVAMEPNNDNGYFLRGVAHERADQCEKAVADYSSAIELFADKDKISSIGYESISRCYEQMGQFCDAATAIESWVALDPDGHDNDQTRTILRRLNSKGKCAKETTAVKEERFRRRDNDVIKVEAEINGAKGTFIVDTGASFVAIKKAFATKAGVKLANGQQIKINTANGVVDGYLTRAGAVKLRSLESKRVQVVVQLDEHDDFGDGVDGLIGMSFLSRFDIALDSKNLRIQPRKQ
jgi:clan AA aspartic protease (TIGR02281 family)